MRRILATMIVMVWAGQALSAPTIEFSPGGPGAGTWIYDGAGTFHFLEDIMVDRSLGDPAGPLVDTLVYLPDLAVTKLPDDSYVLTPTVASGGMVSIRSSGGDILLTGILGVGDLVPVGTTGAGYSRFQADITNVVITPAGQAFGSPALDMILASGANLDFEFTIQGARPSVEEMIADGRIGGNGFSGAITIMPVPVPGAVLLGALGTGLVGWMKSRRFLGS